MTSVVVWVGSDTHGPASLNIATDSRISWPNNQSGVDHWDHAKKVYASRSLPLVIGFLGDATFASLVLPSLIDRIDRGVFGPDDVVVERVAAAIMHDCSKYPATRLSPTTFYIALRVGVGMSCQFELTELSHRPARNPAWKRSSIPIPMQSTSLAVAGSGAVAIREAISIWQATAAAGTSRSIFSGFVDAILSGKDPLSGGAPQLGALYRIGPGRLIGIVHENQRYFAGAHLFGDDAVEQVEWRNGLFERADGATNGRLSGAQVHQRPSMHTPN